MAVLLHTTLSATPLSLCSLPRYPEFLYISFNVETFDYIIREDTRLAMLPLISQYCSGQ
jgi:hypothetical protein